MPDAVRRRERAQWSRAVERAQHWVELPSATPPTRPEPDTRIDPIPLEDPA